MAKLTLSTRPQMDHPVTPKRAVVVATVSASTDWDSSKTVDLVSASGDTIGEAKAGALAALKEMVDEFLATKQGKIGPAEATTDA